MTEEMIALLKQDTLTIGEWTLLVRYSHQRAQAYDKALRERMSVLAKRAHIDDSPLIWHNAWVMRNNGKFWIGVDYSVLYQIKRLQERQFDAYAIHERFSDKLYRTRVQHVRGE